jgi:hypothetical protein
MREAYQKAYKSLAHNYINKMDANFYLSKYVKRVDGIYLPKKAKIFDFVENYYRRYREIGQQVYSK